LVVLVTRGRLYCTVDVLTDGDGYG